MANWTSLSILNAWVWQRFAYTIAHINTSQKGFYSEMIINHKTLIIIVNNEQHAYANLTSFNWILSLASDAWGFHYHDVKM